MFSMLFLAVLTVAAVLLFHLSDSLSASMLANPAGQHSVAISLLRSCIEALTLVDLELQENDYRLLRLRQWNRHERTAGDIRRDLENDVWRRYKHGLWEEPWSQLFGNLARALHPYAHYSPELMGWQMASVRMDDAGRGYVRLGPSQYDHSRPPGSRCCTRLSSGWSATHGPQCGITLPGVLRRNA